MSDQEDIINEEFAILNEYAKRVGETPFSDRMQLDVFLTKINKILSKMSNNPIEHPERTPKKKKHPVYDM